MTKIPVPAAAPIVPCRQLAVSVRFYTETFGLEASVYGDYYAVLTDGRICIHLSLNADDKVYESYGFYLYVDNARAWYERLLPLGCVHPDGHLERKPWGVWEMSALDPDGNLIRIGELSSAGAGGW